MTLSIAVASERRRRASEQDALTFEADLALALESMLERTTRLQFPSDRFQHDPVGFFAQVLGVRLWAKQRAFVEAVATNKRVAWCTGHKVGKSTAIAGLALWHYCSFKDARGVLTSTTSRQVDQILWRELRMLRARGGRCLDCKTEDPDGLVIRRPCPHSAIIDGEQGDLARTGLKSDDFREIVGFTAREPEAVAGISGSQVRYFVDEASGVPDEIFEAIEGNRAGGASIALCGNGTRNEGEFFEAFHSKSRLYFTMRTSSEETPNVVEGREVYPGLAGADWIAEKKDEWGVDSPIYRVRVKGEHPQHEKGKIFNLHLIAEAEARWEETPATGRLYIGLDPAGESGTGDETMFASRRGLKLLGLTPHIGLNEEQHLVQLLLVIRAHKLPRETPVVVVDAEGSIGSKVAIKLAAYCEEHPDAFELVALRSSDRAIRDPIVYDRKRDELAANLEAWFRDGGAIVEDTKLVKELHALEWYQAANGRMKLIDKKVIRKQLGRSPDRYDALALSCWEPLSLRIDDTAAPSVQQHARSTEQAYAPALDPYAGNPFAGGRR